MMVSRETLVSGPPVGESPDPESAPLVSHRMSPAVSRGRQVSPIHLGRAHRGVIGDAHVSPYVWNFTPAQQLVDDATSRRPELNQYSLTSVGPIARRCAAQTSSRMIQRDHHVWTPRAHYRRDGAACQRSAFTKNWP